MKEAELKEAVKIKVRSKLRYFHSIERLKSKSSNPTNG